MRGSSYEPVASAATLAFRRRLRATLRRWFREKNIDEAETSVLVATPVSDPGIRSFSVPLTGTDERRYLHTSPEYQMKRLLAAGSGDIYQIAPVFRDGEAGARHQPEFTLIEWYRLGFGLDEIVADTLELIGLALGPEQSRRIVDFRDAFLAATGLDPLLVTDGELLRACGSVAERLHGDRNACLDWLTATAVIPQLDAGVATVVRHYPVSQAALAAVNPDDERTALRFEIFFAGMEIANGFVELTDPGEQRRRFEQDRKVRAVRGSEDTCPDEALLAALEAGLPPCAGVAVGFDRLVMAALGIRDIRDVQAFPVVPDR